ncbi:NTE family protein/lysophospholipid hydrolase [Algoriphagus boseongensis]|uniref:NTE family protein/lysophospholipid hydrolase n=1 Tax=Algoriphagus boseongensis TaxID=1442587 RepID=A0A4R6T4L8_9BACT|nr:patatin-like phospholipase family protein [Algoriphagus boseongensis]TDQ17441.1 NTE family protein/lysophospholipid hydrolase [Algoriphagus boseongensis]
MNSLKNKYHQLFHKLFGELNDDLLEQIISSGTKKEFNTGEYLFHQGDSESCLYIVLSGRLRAIKEDGNGVRILGDIGEGEPVGEFALFTGEPRMASVLAIRKSAVLEFDQQEYFQLVARNPKLANSMTRFVINRLRRNTFQQNQSSPPKNIALINLQADHDLSPWTIDMEAYFKENGIPVQVFDHESQEALSDHEFFDSLESYAGVNILICSETNPNWSHQCLVYADLVILATDFKGNPALYQIEKDLDLYSQSILNKKIYLLFLHEKEASMPKETSKWLENRTINLHIHVRQGNSGDIRRFCRIITNNATGLVLGGGGAKGYAHLGVVKALQEKGIEIDFLGGTSAGAIYGITMSFSDFDFEKIEVITQHAVESKLTSNDISLPLISFLSGKKVKKFVKNLFKEFGLEDIWVNSYCVSTNYSRASAKIHDRGPIWQQVMASMAIPGVFPPVVIDQYLHVDGAVMDNLPIEPMYRYPISKIIAVSLSGLIDRKVEFESTPSNWSIFWDKFSRKSKYKLPNVGSLIINSLMLNSHQKQEVTKSKVSHYFELNLKGVGLLDESKWKEILKKGYDQTNEYLEQLPKEERFWEK